MGKGRGKGERGTGKTVRELFPLYPFPLPNSGLFLKRMFQVESPIMTRRVLLYPGEDGFVVAEAPSLPGCISQGRTREEALENVREAISLHEEVWRERGEPLPEDRVELVEVAA